MRWFCPGLFLSLLVPLVLATLSYGQIETSPLEFLKGQELRHKDEKGEVYLGKLMTVYFDAYSVDADKNYYPVFLELTVNLTSPFFQRQSGNATIYIFYVRNIIN